MAWEVAYIDKEGTTPVVVYASSTGNVRARNAETNAEYDLTADQLANVEGIIKGLVENTLAGDVEGLRSIVGAGPKTDLPLAGQPGGEERFYIATDASEWYRDVGYVVADSDAAGGPAYAWEDISDSGTQVTLTDDSVETVDIGFDFPFLHGQVATQAHIGDNGIVGLGASDGVTNAANVSIPSDGTPNNIVCPFWDDLDPTAEGATLHYQTLGTQPDRRLVVQYTGFQVKSTTDNLTFQAILHEDGRIKFQYKEMPGAGDGSSATIGVEGKAGATGVEVSHDTAYIHDEMAVLIEPRWELMFGADALALDSSQRSLQFGTQQSAIGDHTHDLPDAPADLTGEGLDQQIVLTWSNPNSPSVTSYEYWDPVDSAWEPIPGSGRDTTTYTVTGLANDVTYQAQVRAINSYADGDGASEAATVNVLVENHPPVAYAGDPQTVNKGDTVTLNGSATDEFPEELTYSWSHSDPRWPPLVPITDPTSAAATFTAPVWIESLSFDLTITDRHGLNHEASTTVAIINRLPALTLDVADTVEAGDLVTLSVSAVDPDAGDPLTYFWFQQLGAVVTLSDPNSANPTFITPSEPAALVFGIFVTDGSGGYVVRFVTMEVNEPGVVTLSTETPAEGIELTASLTDPDGDIHDIAWQWASSTDWDPATESGTWTDIGGAASDWFTPGSGPVGNYLRATATYADARSPGRTAQAISVNPVEANNAPTFAEGNSTTRSVDENSAPGTHVGSAVSATDADGDNLTYYLTRGDASLFAIDAVTGQLTVGPSTVLDYEVRSTYAVAVNASDGRGGSDVIAVIININNIDEPGTVSFDSSTPEAGQALIASLTDPDGSVSGAAWQWAWSSDWDADTEVGTWADITGATSARYTPVRDDVRNYLRATAIYADVHGTNKTAFAVSDNAVSASR